MNFVMIGDESFNSDAIKVIQRVKIEDNYAVQFYVNIGDIGKLFELQFSDLLKRDNAASKIAYSFIVNCLVHKRSGVINLEIIVGSLSKLYRETIKIYSESYVDMNNLQELRDSIMKDYFEAVNRLAESLL